MESKRPLPIGVDSYKKIIDKPYYYVDKTLLIKDLLDKGGEVNLFTRPRRFGKTLALTMLQSFFEKEIDHNGAIVGKGKYFQNTKVAGAGEFYMQHMGQYPVIFLTLKSAKQPTFEMAYTSLTDEIHFAKKLFGENEKIAPCNNPAGCHRHNYLGRKLEHSVSADCIALPPAIPICSA